jgi:hypothetical protein
MYVQDVDTRLGNPKWGRVLHDEDLAEAIVDRILERGRLLRLDGPSVRTRHLPGDDLAEELQDDSTSRRMSGTNAAEFPERTRPTLYARRQVRRD